MREIKFRVWDNDEKIIKKVESINFPLGGESSSKTVCVYNEEEYCYEWVYDYELMQYTGIKDKNNKEIYEGDIVEFYSNVEDEIITEKVEYHFGIYRAGDYFVGKIYNKCEVIGNIYENKDLLVE